MGTEVVVLFNGFSEVKSVENGEIMLANCTCTLIKSCGVNIIVDTMTPWDSERLLHTLKEHQVTPKDINYVVSTHGHSDHVGNNNLFLDAERHIVGNNISFKETYYLHNWATPFVINEDVEIIRTPGHTPDCVSVIVKGINLGQRVAIAGDLFEREEDVLDDRLWRDAGSFNEDVQRENRAKIAQMVDVIIPGHGPAFPVTQQIKEELERQVHNSSAGDTQKRHSKMGSWVEQTVNTFRNLDLRRLNVDEAYVNVSSRYSTHLWMYSLSDECHRCPFTPIQEIKPSRDHVFKVSTKYGVSWKFVEFFERDVGPYALDADRAARVVCELRPDMGEFGVYDVLIDDTKKCSVTTALQPVNIYLPFVVFIIIILALIALIRGICFAKKYYRRSQESPDDDQEERPEAPVKKRLRSLDTFRGLCIVLMVFVNSGAGGYTALEHITWNGIHFADFIFPWFLWIMGVCIPMSVKSQLVRNVSKADMLLNVLRRSVTLFVIGVCLNTLNGAQLEELRIFGVLQRFGVAYLVVAGLHIVFRRIGSLPPQNAIARAVYDIRILMAEWGVMLVVVTVHLALAFGLSVPGCGRGYLGPGGMHEMNHYNHCIGGATGYIDRLILTNNHIYQHPTAKKVYGSEAFDPEGAFGCLLTIFQVFLGVQCGMILLVHSDWKARVKRWVIWGATIGIIGASLCEFRKEDGLIPINKNMWSLSFVLVTSGVAFVLLATMYIVVDVRGSWRGAPLVYAGMNAIAIYVGHQVFHKMLPWHWSIGPMNTHMMRLLESGWTTALWVGIAYYLYKRKLFYSI